MGIVFYCQSCGARFEVDSRMAGKKGHCKKCGQLMSIPRPEQIASMTAIPALAGTGAGSTASGASIGSVLKNDLSKIALAPITMDRIPLRANNRKSTKPTAMSVLDDAEDSKPYILAQPLPRSSGQVSRGANLALGFWRRQVGKFQKVFRSLNETAYLFSIPFIILLLIGIAVKSRSTALLGATFVVVLSVGRIVAGLANLASVPLRDGFDAKKMKHPFRSVVEPLATIAAIVVAFTFIPWLSSGKRAGASLVDRLNTNARSLREDIKGELRKTAAQVKNLDIEKIGEGAEKKLDKLRGAGKESRK